LLRSPTCRVILFDPQLRDLAVNDVSDLAGHFRAAHLRHAVCFIHGFDVHATIASPRNDGQHKKILLCVQRTLPSSECKAALWIMPCRSYADAGERDFSNRPDPDLSLRQQVQTQKKTDSDPPRIGQRNEFVPRIGKPRPQCQHVWESRIFRNIPIPLLDSLTGSSAGRGILHRFCRHLFPVVREFFRSP